MKFINYTSYNKAEDIKRLRFISENILTLPKGSTILDIGCGNGNISFQLARMGYVVTGIDASYSAVEKANILYGGTPGLNFTVKSAEQLVEDKHDLFDAIVCSEVIEHLQDPLILVGSFKSLVKENGLAVVTVPNGFGPREALITKPMKSINESRGLIAKIVNKIKNAMGYSGFTRQSAASNLDHIQFFSMKELSKLADAGGFSIVKKAKGDFVENVFPFSLLTRRIYFLQKFDCWMADILPLAFTSAFYTVWKSK